MDDPHLAEAMAIKEALSWVVEKGWRKAVILLDCQLVCKLMIDNSSLDFSYAGCIIRDCQSLKIHFDLVFIHYVSRSANKLLAHALAREAISQSGPMIWFNSVPSRFQHLVHII